MTLPPMARRAVAGARVEDVRADNEVERPMLGQELERERSQVGPKDASWPMHSCGNTAKKGLKLAQLLGQLGAFLTLDMECSSPHSKNVVDAAPPSHRRYNH
jgi:hypothetical protein